MQFWVGITDREWFDSLRALEPDEVNFWQPTAKPPRIMEPGWPFLFKLHSPHNFIVGGGFFVSFSVLPCFLAWDAFETKNGVADQAELVARVSKYSKRPETSGTRIGCNILAEPFFFAEDDWIPIPDTWPRHTQRGLTFDTQQQTGRSLWAEVIDRLQRIPVLTSVPRNRFGSAYLARARLGQGAFRTLVTDAYKRRCSVTGERSLPALEAAHIRPYKSEGPNRTSNGLLLRADVHRLFDEGYVTVDPDFRFLVSKKLKEEFENGRIYYDLHGQALKNLPDRVEDRPNREYLAWHNETFRG